MMWKESYRIGVERIDAQHMELFRMTEELVEAVEGNTSSEACQKAIGFLKDYVIYHFQDEEAYQESVHYSGIEAHKAEHRQFTQTVLNYEKQLAENGFQPATMRDLAGTVTAWLIYHVADTDQKMTAGQVLSPEDRRFEQYVDFFSASALEVMETMAGMDRNSARQHASDGASFHGDIFIEIGLIGDLKGSVVLGFSRELALNLIHAMTIMKLTELDELVQSALCELTNISCGNAATAITRQGLVCDIKPPVVSETRPVRPGAAGITIDTGAGEMEVVLCEDKASFSLK